MPGPSIIIEADARTLESAERLMQAYPRQAPYALARALTKVAKEHVKPRIEAEMASVFDRPTPFVLKSLRVRPATKDKPQAEVLFKDESYKGTPATEYLRPHVDGGPRALKRSESLLRNAGLLGPAEWTVPGKTIPLDQYGNVRRGTLTRILSNVRAQTDAAQNTTDGRRSRYFVKTIKGTTAVWERYGRGARSVRPALVFVSQPTYQKRLRFYEIGQEVVVDVLPEEFMKAWVQAIASARETQR